jgi:hypothetical protein
MPDLPRIDSVGHGMRGIMKLCRAGALSLVGWYLMLLPYGNTLTLLRTWEMDGAFDNAKDCEASKVEKLERLRSAGKAEDRIDCGDAQINRHAQCYRAHSRRSPA